MILIDAMAVVGKAIRITEKNDIGVCRYHPCDQLPRLTPRPDNDDFDRRPQRRRYEEPLHVKIRKQLLSIAESVHGTMRSIEMDPADDSIAR